MLVLVLGDLWERNASLGCVRVLLLTRRQDGGRMRQIPFESEGGMVGSLFTPIPFRLVVLREKV